MASAKEELNGGKEEKKGREIIGREIIERRGKEREKKGEKEKNGGEETKEKGEESNILRTAHARALASGAHWRHSHYVRLWGGCGWRC